MRLRIAALCSVLLVAFAAPAQAQWATGPGLPNPLSQTATAADNQGNVYVFGGQTQYSGFTVAYNCAHSYNYCTDTWTGLPFMLWSSYGGEAVFHAPTNRIYVTGGVLAAPGTIYAWDITAGTFDYTLAPAPTATNSWQPTWILDEASGLIHWIGGEDWGTEHLVYNPFTDSWSTAAAPPTPIFGSGGAYDPATGLIVTIGGWGANNSNLGSATRAVQRYNPATNSWSYGAQFPTNARFQHAVSRNPVDGLIYAFGGSSAYFDGSAPYYDDVWTYSVIGDSWTYVGQNPLGGNREVGGEFDSYGILHLLGGDTGTGPLNRQESFSPAATDADGDGFDTVCDGDCDDNNASIWPGAPELCDGLDNDCDGVVPGTEIDNDGDGVVECNGDCDDANTTVYPGAPELCDGLDNDCNGVLPATELDSDGDGFAVCDGDCNDANNTVFPDAPELCDGLDNDCDGVIPGTEIDNDGDGVVECNGDCDDANNTVYPGAPELCDGLDNDCNGVIPGNESDADNDGWAVCDGDCNDGAAAINPGATEVCDGLDNDCDGAVDEGFDADNDGWTSCGGDCDDNEASTNPDCPDPCDGVDNNCDGNIDELYDVDGDGYTTCNGDCDDTNVAINPGAAEVCDGVDNDCDGTVDEGFDADGDGWTSCGGDCDDNEASTNPDCPDPCDGVDNNCDGNIDELYDVDGDGWTTCNGDCDDTNASVNPGATEVCNGVDDDCDGQVDEGFDTDGDGYTSCGGDCDDTDASVNLGATEVCDGIDNDCDGAVDEGFDADSDGWTSCGGDCDDNEPTTNPDCPDPCDGVDNNCDGNIDELYDVDGDGFTTCNGDCDDTNAAVNPDATELCGNGIDDDCDGVVDEGDDADGDGVTTCDGDCDDADPNTYPGAAEICDGNDNDCDGQLPPDEVDWDGDGISGCDGDCNDGDDTIYPGAPEFCDNIDTDCDGAADNGFDQDGDGIPDCIDSCPMLVDHDNNPWGDVILAGDDVTHGYMNWGITVERYLDPSLVITEPALAYDSSNPLPGDENIGTPNIEFGGPGIGAGGGLGAPGENSAEHGNVMKATAGNTWWIVNFTSSTCVHDIDFIDVEQGELAAQVILFDVNVQTIATFTSSGLGENSVENLDLGGTCGVFVMLIDFYGDGAWDNLNVCVDPVGSAELCGDGLDNDGDGLVDEDCVNVGDDDDDDDDDDDGEDDDDDGEDEEEEGCSAAGQRVQPRLWLLFVTGFAVLGLRRRMGVRAA